MPTPVPDREVPVLHAVEQYDGLRVEVRDVLGKKFVDVAESADERLEPFLTHTLMSRLEGVVAELDADEQATYLEMIHNYFGIQDERFPLSKNSHGGAATEFSFNDAFVGDVFRGFGPEILQRTFQELLRAEFLKRYSQGEHMEMFAPRTNHSDILVLYGKFLSTPPDEFAEDLVKDGHYPSIKVMYHGQHGFRQSHYDAAYDNDPDLFADQMLTIAGQLDDVGLEAGLATLSTNDESLGFGNRIRISGDKLPYRVEHRKEDVARVRARLEELGDAGGESVLTYADMKASYEDSERRVRALEEVDAARSAEFDDMREQVQRVESENGELKGAFLDEQDRSDELQLRVDESGVALQDRRQRVWNLMSSWMKRMLRYYV